MASPVDVIPLKKRMVENGTEQVVLPVPPVVATLGSKKRTPEQSRALRLAQNRKAARESRRRKKSLVEELQRSLVFFSRTNAVLKQQNDDITRRLLDAHSILAKMGEPVPSLKGVQKPETQGIPTSQVEVVPLAPAAAASPAPAGAECLIKPRPANLPLPFMQPGATMQAMADFQQAAAVAMQAAEKGMKSNIGALTESTEVTQIQTV